MTSRWSSLVGGLALVVAVSGRAAAQTESVLDLNRATREQLIAYPGIGQAYADKIIAARPFKMRSELVSRKIMPATEYLKLKKGLSPTAEDAAAEAAAIKPYDPGPPKDADGRVNLNSASRADLLAVQGIGQQYVDKVIAGRPYKSVDEIVKRNVMPATQFAKVRPLVFVQP